MWGFPRLDQQLNMKSPLAIWLENPYWHFFSAGETYLQTELPIDRRPDPVAPVHRRGVELLLAVTIEAAPAAGLNQAREAGQGGDAQVDCPSDGQQAA